jgi:Ca-activated chloride channel family protein
VSFDHPLLLLAFLAIPAAVGVYLLAERRRMRYAMRYTNIEVLAAVVGGRPWRRYIPPIVFLGALAALCVAVARPHVERLMPRERAAVILVVDVSRSMQARDVRPSRLAAAQEAVRVFLDRVPKQLRVGLVVFAGEAMVGAPPTTDREVVRESVDELGNFPGFGTAIGDALAEAVQVGQSLFEGESITIASRSSAQSDPATRGLVSILFLSDGRQTRGTLLPLEGAELAKNAGFRVYTIALGTPNGTVPDFRGFSDRRIPVPPDPQTLRAIADTTGGEFFDARSAEALGSAYSKLGSRLGREPGRTEVTNWFVAAGAGLLLAAALLSALWSPRLP